MNPTEGPLFIGCEHPTNISMLILRGTVDMSDDDITTSENEYNTGKRVVKINDQETNRDRPAADGGMNALFEVFTNKRRRYILYYVYEIAKPVTIEEIAEYVLVQEAETDVTDLSEKELQPCVLDIYHSHLPKLEQANVVDYDPRSHTVRAWEHAERVQPILEVAKQLEDTFDT